MKEFPPVALFKKFVNERSHNKKEHIRLLVFMTGSLEIISIMILHLIGFIGLELPVLRLISCLSLLIFHRFHRTLSEQVDFTDTGFFYLFYYSANTGIRPYSLSCHRLSAGL